MNCSIITLRNTCLEFRHFIQTFLYCGTCLYFAVLPAQSYNPTGSAIQLPGTNVYQLTPSSGNERGAVWHTDSISLQHSFSIQVLLNFGSRDADGADGIAFVMQTAGSNTVGNHGGGLGYEGYNPSIVIEFDTYQNVTDPGYDHTALHLNGNIFHGMPDCLAGPVPIDTGFANVEDGNNHLLQINWNAKQKVLTMSFDCNERLRHKLDLNAVFKNGKAVYWGFTSGTGTHYNIHRVAFGSEAFTRKSFNICPGDSLTLVSAESADRQYIWNPVGISGNDSGRSIRVVPAQHQIYTVTYINGCGATVRDSFEVGVIPVLKPDLGRDTILCGVDSFRISPGGTYKTYTWQDASTAKSHTTGSNGYKILEVLTEEGCRSADTIQVQFRKALDLNLGVDTTVCASSAILLAGPSGLNNYSWNDGSRSRTLRVNRTGTYILTITDSAYCTISDTVKITFDPDLIGSSLILPNAFSPDANGINETFPDPVPFSGEFYELKIFSRWGELLFQSTSPGDTWNGLYRGSRVAPGVYLYMLSYIGCDGKGRSKHGTVTLLH